jgi:MFS family permease
MNDHSRNWAEPQRFALVLAAMVFLPFWKVLLGFDTFAVRDWGLFSLPVASFYKECFWRGEWPLWNPYSCCGTPFLAQFNTLTLYPLSLIYLLLPLTWSLPAFCLGHIFLGGMGMYFLARRWTGSQAAAAVAGVAFAFNGLSLNFLMWPSHIATFSWMPWVVLLTEDGWRNGGTKMMTAALAAGIQILAGGPETIAFTWLMVLSLAAVECARQPRFLLTMARRLTVMGLLALGLAAAQLLPTIDLTRHSHRDSHYGRSDLSMPLLGWANFLVPMFQMTPMQQIVVQPGQYWTSSYYAGIGVVFLAGLALWRGGRNSRIWMLGALLLASLVLALGYNGFVFRWLQWLIPVLGLFRFPIKFVILTLAIMPLLAAWGFAHYEKQPLGARRDGRAESILAAAMLVLIGVVLWMAREWPSAKSPWSSTATNALWRVVFLGLTLLALYFFVRRPQWRGCSILPVLVLCWLDVLTHEPWQNPTADPSLFQHGLAALKAQFDPKPNISESRLMMSPYSAQQLYYGPAPDMKDNILLNRSVFLANFNLLDDLPKVDGFFSLNLRESDKVLWLLDSRSGPKLDSLEDMLSVSQTIAPGKVFDWMPRANYIPIVSFGQAPVFADDATAFDAIEKGAADFRSVVYLPLEARGKVQALGEKHARLLNKSFTTSKVSLEVETPAPTIFVIGQAYYHNWEATVDGVAAPLWRANYAFQAVEAPAGKHHILLVYKDKALRAGGAISVASILTCGFGWLVMRRKPVGGKTLLFTSA